MIQGLVIYENAILLLGAHNQPRLEKSNAFDG